jgi:hypothetical protein
VTRKRLRRGQMLTFFAGLPPCLVGMEACATAHYWARANGAWPRGSPYATPICEDVKAYLKRDKNDAADAEAIREAVRRPSMRFVPVKTKEQRSALVMHRGRELLVRQRTMLANALRGHLAEFGLIAAQGLHNVAGLIAIVRNDEDGRVPAGHAASGAAGDRRCDRQARHADCRHRGADHGLAQEQSYEPALGGHPRHRADHRHRHCGPTATTSRLWRPTTRCWCQAELDLSLLKTSCPASSSGGHNDRVEEARGDHGRRRGRVQPAHQRLRRSHSGAAACAAQRPD